MIKEVKAIVTENHERNKAFFSPFNPLTGEGSIGQRIKVTLSDFTLRDQWLPVEMMEVPLVARLAESGSIEAFHKSITDIPFSPEEKEKIVDRFVRIRHRYDFPFWAFTETVIKPKETDEGTGDDIPFRLNRQQRRLIASYERQRLAGRPIRLVLAKSRQWGGSTATQIYIMWLQLVHRKGLNSLVVGHQKDSSSEVTAMFEKIIRNYPVRLLHQPGEDYDEGEPKFTGDPRTQNIHTVPQRNCKIKIGTAEKPDSARGGDSALVHLTEVAFFKKTEGKTPQQIVRSACAGALNKPYTMIVYESSPNGTGNFFQTEYEAAKKGQSVFEAMFVAWHEIEQYRKEFRTKKEEEEFARRLWENRLNDNVMSDREEPGKYLWWLWEICRAPLEAIAWYVDKRSEFTDHADMASEFPSDDIEAFVNSGSRVFDVYNVNKFKDGCRPPRYIGDVSGMASEGPDAVKGVHFNEDRQGQLWIWDKPEVEDNEKILNRYLVVVDIGGRSSKADWSVITVIDRLWMMDGEPPVIVAQWYGHIDMDILSWKAAQIAKYYDDALLVIESNTLETKDRDRYVEGDQSQFILNEIKNVYDNLYARKQSAEDIAEGKPVKYGFHTNTKTKPVIISWLVKMVREHGYVERDERVLDEFLSYERKQNGAYGAILGKHDDLLMTRAIGLFICCKEMEDVRIVERIRQDQSARRKAVSAATI
jgi:hypothetical protein